MISVSTKETLQCLSCKYGPLKVGIKSVFNGAQYKGFNLVALVEHPSLKLSSFIDCDESNVVKQFEGRGELNLESNSFQASIGVLGKYSAADGYDAATGILIKYNKLDFSILSQMKKSSCSIALQLSEQLTSTFGITLDHEKDAAPLFSVNIELK